MLDQCGYTIEKFCELMAYWLSCSHRWPTLTSILTKLISRWIVFIFLQTEFLLVLPWRWWNNFQRPSRYGEDGQYRFDLLSNFCYEVLEMFPIFFPVCTRSAKAAPDSFQQIFVHWRIDLFFWFGQAGIFKPRNPRIKNYNIVIIWVTVPRPNTE